MAKIYTYEEYIEESKKEPSIDKYPVPDSPVKPAPGDKIVYYMRDELKKSKKKMRLFPAIVLDHRS